MISEKDNLKTSYIKSLIDVALSDELIDEQEIILLTKIAKRFNLPDTEIKAIKKNHKNLKFIPPTDLRQQFDMIYDIMHMMMVDGNIDEREMQLCHKYAIQLGFASERLSKMLKIIHEDIAKGKSRNNTRVKIEQYRAAS